MSDHSPEAIQKHLKIYIGVFLALLLGTVLTVWAWTWHFENVALTVSIALFIACVKAFLVAGFFMHLISERKAIYGIMLATVFFFGGLMYLTVWHYSQKPAGAEHFGDRLTSLEFPHVRGE